MIYQSMQLSFQRGRMIIEQGGRPVRISEFAPNLAIIPKVSAAYEQAMDEDEKNRDHIQTAHRNFLRDAVYFLYTYNHQADAIHWYKYLAEKYPDKPLLESMPTSLPRNLTLDQYAIGRIQGEIESPGRDKAMAILQGLERTGLESLAIDDDERYLGMDGIAQKVWNHYEEKISVNTDTSDTRGNPIAGGHQERCLASAIARRTPTGSGRPTSHQAGHGARCPACSCAY